MQGQPWCSNEAIELFTSVKKNLLNRNNKYGMAHQTTNIEPLSTARTTTAAASVRSSLPSFKQSEILSPREGNLLQNNKATFYQGPATIKKEFTPISPKYFSKRESRVQRNGTLDNQMINIITNDALTSENSLDRLSQNSDLKYTILNIQNSTSTFNAHNLSKELTSISTTSGFSKLQEIRSKFEHGIHDLNAQVDAYMQKNVNQKKFLQLLKEREDFITETFYKCQNHRNSLLRKSMGGNNYAVQEDLMYSLFDALKEQMLSLARYHVRAHAISNFKEQQIKNEVIKMVKCIRHYQQKEISDQEYQQNIFKHMTELNMELEQFIKNTEILQTKKTDLSIEFSGVTTNLEDLETQFNFAQVFAKNFDQNTSHFKKNSSIYDINQVETVDFNQLEQGIQKNILQVQNGTALRVLKRFFKKKNDNHVEVQTTVTDANTQRYFELEDDLYIWRQKYQQLEEQLTTTKGRLNEYEQYNQQAKQEISSLRVILEDTKERLQTTTEEAQQLKHVVEEQEIKVQETVAQLVETKKEMQRVEEEKVMFKKRMGINKVIDDEHYKQLQELEDHKARLKASIMELQTMNDYLRNTNQKIKEDLWNAIEKWQKVEGDLAQEYNKSMDSQDKMMDLKKQLQKMREDNVQMEMTMKFAQNQSQKLLGELSSSRLGSAASQNRSGTMEIEKSTFANQQRLKNNLGQKVGFKGITEEQSLTPVTFGKQETQAEDSPARLTLKNSGNKKDSNMDNGGKRPTMDLNDPMGYVASPASTGRRRDKTPSYKKFSTMRMDMIPGNRKREKIIVETDSDEFRSDKEKIETTNIGVQTDLNMENMIEMLVKEVDAYKDHLAKIEAEKNKEKEDDVTMRAVAYISSSQVEQGLLGDSFVFGKGKLHKGFAMKGTAKKEEVTQSVGFDFVIGGGGTAKANPSPEKKFIQRMKTILKKAEANQLLTSKHSPKPSPKPERRQLQK